MELHREGVLIYEPRKPSPVMLHGAHAATAVTGIKYPTAISNGNHNATAVTNGVHSTIARTNGHAPRDDLSKLTFEVSASTFPTVLRVTSINQNSSDLLHFNDEPLHFSLTEPSAA